MMKTIFKKITVLILVISVIFSLSITSVYANSGVTIRTTLADGSIQKGSKKTFDVIARNANQEKIASTVTLNGENVKANWDDQNKTSYTLNFNKEGENLVVVSAGGDSVTYRITYQKANKGDITGYATWSIEALTINYGFILDPIIVPIIEGENAAQTLDRILTENGFSYDHTGKLESGFYLSILAQGGRYSAGSDTAFASGEKFNPPVNVEDKIPSALKPFLDKDGTFIDELMTEGELGEFDYTYMSGWMYAINSVFPNVGFSDSYLSDGDVVRVQFTLYGYGADIGGGYAMGGENSDFYPIARKDALLGTIAMINSASNKEELLAKPGLKVALDYANKVATTLDATQDEVDKAQERLYNAFYSKPLIGISLDKTEIKLEIGKEETLSVLFNGEPSNDQIVEWSSSDPSIVKVENGKVTAIKEGNAKITAKIESFEATCSVVVKNNQSTIIIEDKNTGLELTAPNNVLPKDTVLKAEPVTELQIDAYKKIKESLKEISDRFTSFDISVLSQGKKVQPNGKVSLKLPIPKDYDSSKIVVYRIADDGALVELASKVINNEVVFETDHFSLFAIAEKTEKEPQPENKPPIDNKPGKPSGDPSPDTGDHRSDLPLVMFLSSAVLCCLVIKTKTSKTPMK